jgi:hypothetical protein
LSGAPRQTNSAMAQLTPSSDLDEFDIITNRSKSAMNASSPTNDLLNRENNNLNNNGECFYFLPEGLIFIENM